MPLQEAAPRLLHLLRLSWLLAVANLALGRAAAAARLVITGVCSSVTVRGRLVVVVCGGGDGGLIQDLLLMLLLLLLRSWYSSTFGLGCWRVIQAVVVKWFW